MSTDYAGYTDYTDYADYTDWGAASVQERPGTWPRFQIMNVRVNSITGALS